MIPSNIEVFLASNSPRRKELLSDLGVVFSVIQHRAEETWPTHLPPSEVAEFIANKKANSINALQYNQLLIASDTVVCLGGDVLGKPTNEDEAVAMLKALSGNVHHVYTGVALRFNDQLMSFTEKTTVFMNPLNNDEIKRYVRSAEPFDKAGGYAIQEWIGTAKIVRIEGSYTNVVGLPTAQLYQHILTFINRQNDKI